MKYIDEFSNSQTALRLVADIKKHSGDKRWRLMEFCGSNTVAIFKFGIRQLLEDRIEMLSGPGCPVCVTSVRDLDKSIALAKMPNVIITTFGDLLRVPSSDSSLQQARADGGDVRVVYSTLDALDIAKNNPAKQVVFIGIGFETTAPTIAASIIQAKQEKIDNYSVISLHKVTPPVTWALLDSGETDIDGIICPGHVSTIIGSDAWRYLPEKYGIACAVSGFEPLDILYCIDLLVKQLEKGKPKVDIAYPRAVSPQGNVHALKLMDEVFELAPADWRGIGIVPGSGLKINEQYAAFDVENRIVIPLDKESKEAKGCICGDILRGVRTPFDCKLFGKGCTPEYPVGPCMVSSEGTCAAYYHYGGADDKTR